MTLRTSYRKQKKERLAEMRFDRFGFMRKPPPTRTFVGLCYAGRCGDAPSIAPAGFKEEEREQAYQDYILW